jgi:hypothetical protein
MLRTFLRFLSHEDSSLHFWELCDERSKALVILSIAGEERQMMVHGRCCNKDIWIADELPLASQVSSQQGKLASNRLSDPNDSYPSQELTETRLMLLAIAPVIGVLVHFSHGNNADRQLL